MLAFGQAGVLTVGSDSSVNNISVAQCGNGFLSNQDFVTDRAVLAFGQAGFGTGRIDSRVDDPVMVQSGNLFLSNQDFITDGAVLALGQAGFGTGRIDSRVDDPVMVQSGNLFLSNQDFITDGAVLALGQAGFGTGRIDSRVDDPVMVQSGNLFLSNQDFITDGAVLALGQAGGGTGSCNSLVNDLSVAQCGDLGLGGDHGVTDGAVGAFGFACGGAGCGYCCVGDGGVGGQLGNLFGDNVAAAGTGLGPGACLLTGGFLCDGPVAVAVTRGCNNNITAFSISSQGICPITLCNGSVDCIDRTGVLHGKAEATTLDNISHNIVASIVIGNSGIAGNRCNCCITSNCILIPGVAKRGVFACTGDRKANVIRATGGQACHDTLGGHPATLLGNGFSGIDNLIDRSGGICCLYSLKGDYTAVLSRDGAGSIGGTFPQAAVAGKF